MNGMTNGLARRLPRGRRLAAPAAAPAAVAAEAATRRVSGTSPEALAVGGAGAAAGRAAGRPAAVTGAGDDEAGAVGQRGGAGGHDALAILRAPLTNLDLGGFFDPDLHRLERRGVVLGGDEDAALAVDVDDRVGRHDERILAAAGLDAARARTSRA